MCWGEIGDDRRSVKQGPAGYGTGRGGDANRPGNNSARHCRPHGCAVRYGEILCCGSIEFHRRSVQEILSVDDNAGTRSGVCGREVANGRGEVKQVCVGVTSVRGGDADSAGTGTGRNYCG